MKRVGMPLVPELSADEQVALMNIDLEIEALIRDLDETMEWEADDIDRALAIQYMRWAYIEGYTAMGLEMKEMLAKHTNRY
jgi:hypothetical protein